MILNKYLLSVKGKSKVNFLTFLKLAHFWLTSTWLTLFFWRIPNFNFTLLFYFQNQLTLTSLTLLFSIIPNFNFTLLFYFQNQLTLTWLTLLFLRIPNFNFTLLYFFQNFLTVTLYFTFHSHCSSLTCLWRVLPNRREQ